MVVAKVPAPVVVKAAALAAAAGMVGAAMAASVAVTTMLVAAARVGLRPMHRPSSPVVWTTISRSDRDLWKGPRERPFLFGGRAYCSVSSQMVMGPSLTRA